MAKRMKEKAAARLENADKRPHATVRYIRISPYKVRSVIDIVRGKNVSEAIAILENTQKSASDVVRKLIASAAANAEFMDLSRSDMIVKEIFADQGPSLKRIRPKDHGRAHRILKRTSHITVILDSVKEGK